MYYFINITILYKQKGKRQNIVELSDKINKKMYKIK